MKQQQVNEVGTSWIRGIRKFEGTPGFSTEYVKIWSSSRFDAGSDTDLSGVIYVTRSYGDGITGDSASLGDGPSSAQSYEAGQVVVSTGKVGSGYIRINANPNDTSTPYIDIVERTGSGLYDVELKARLGDLSGLSSTPLVLGKSNPGFGLATDNVYLQGGITATFGEIGGFGINETTISSSNNNLILSSSGEITGSSVLFDGGKIGGFELTSTQINSSNDELVLKSNGEITGSNVLFDGGTLGGLKITTDTLETTTLLSSPDGTPAALISASGVISGSDLYIRQVVDLGSGNAVYPLIDTQNGLLDGRNLGRQVIADYNEYYRTNIDDGSDYFEVNSWIFHLLNDSWRRPFRRSTPFPISTGAGRRSGP